MERENAWERYDSPITPVERPNHRPRRTYKVVLRTVDDVLKGIDLGLPLILVRSDDLKILHYPLRMPPTVIVPREFASVIESDLRMHVFNSLTPFKRRRFEDVIVFLLSYDLIAARAVVERNLDLIDLGYLLKRVLQEDLEEQSTAIRLQDFIDVPVAGEHLPRKALARATEGNRVSGVVP